MLLKSWQGKIRRSTFKLYARPNIAFIGNMPFAYTPFIYSDQLMLSALEDKVPSGVKIISINSQNFNSFWDRLKSGAYSGNSKDDVIFKIAYFPEYFSEHLPQHGYLFFEVDWDNPAFKNIPLRKTIAPKEPLKLLELPADKMSVALHVRLGGSYGNDRVNV